MTEAAEMMAFITARLDEHQAAAARAQALRDKLDDPRRQIDQGVRDGAEHAWHETAADPARIVRSVEATRRILARYEDCLVRTEDPDYSTYAAVGEAREYEDFVLPNLAAEFSDHPGYDQEWAP